MRVVIQRVKKASVKEKNKIKAKIGRGLLLYLAVARDDTPDDVDALVEKIVKLRLFPQRGKQHDFQLAVKDIKGKILVIPNYTLYSDVLGGNRPYFGEAAAPAEAKRLYQEFLAKLRKALGAKSKAKAKFDLVKTGTFGEFMEVAAVNDGPATIILETALLEEDYYENGSGEDEYSEGFDDLLDKLGVELEL